MSENTPIHRPIWVTIDRPGQFGKQKDNQILTWNDKYGENNWRISWELNSGELFDYEDIFWKVYVPGYTHYFMSNIDQAVALTTQYSYTYDKDWISRQTAFDQYALYDKPDIVNQFHHVALNIALEWFLGLPFNGTEPLQVREEKPGWQWSPGRIPTTRSDVLPMESIDGWWEKGSIEDVYQSTKVLQVLQ